MSTTPSLSGRTAIVTGAPSGIGRAIAESRGQLRQNVDRSRETLRELLRGSSQLAELYLEKEALARDIVSQVDLHESLTKQKAASADEVHALRRQARKRSRQRAAALSRSSRTWSSVKLLVLSEAPVSAVMKSPAPLKRSSGRSARRNDYSK